MSQEPEIKMLPYKNRQRFFAILCTVFILALPALIFYTTGHRLNFDDSAQNTIVTTGGMYITTDNLDVDVYLNDEQVRRPRLFRSAYYIQNIESGIHRAVVQQNGLNTWVKDLPVDAYMVIEAAAFNMPVTPQVRLISEYVDEDQVAVFPSTASTSRLFTEATSTVPYVFATTSATTSLTFNPEYEFVLSLFSTSSATSSSAFGRFLNEVERFRFSTTTEEGVASTTEVFRERGNIRLLEREDGLYASWVGDMENAPYYFCVSNRSTSTIAERYGTHVADQIAAQQLSTTTELYIDDNRICRQDIKIDQKRQNVYHYNFLPGTSDLVLLQLDDGLYVSEIDDRAWQNTQKIFDGSNFEVLVENDSIYLKIENNVVELLTEIPE